MAGLASSHDLDLVVDGFHAVDLARDAGGAVALAVGGGGAPERDLAVRCADVERGGLDLRFAFESLLHARGQSLVGAMKLDLAGTGIVPAAGR